MSVHELTVPLSDQVPDFALARLQHWALEKPLQIALRHRRHGTWKAWRWIDVLREVERTAAALSERGFGPGSRLALSGAFEPTLLLLALAAKRAGGQTLVVSRQARDEELRRQLLLARPGYAYVQRRENVSHWLLAGADSEWALQLFSAQSGERSAGAWKVLALDTLLGNRAPDLHRLGWRHTWQEESVWNDEGTEWADGLSRILEHWLSSGLGFAFPETSESAARDLRDIAPSVLLLSAPRLQTLAAEIESRLAPLGSWRRQLCDWTLLDARYGVRRWIKARVRHLLGFQRVRSIVQGAPLPYAAPRPTWFRALLEKAA